MHGPLVALQRSDDLLNVRLSAAVDRTRATSAELQPPGFPCFGSIQLVAKRCGGSIDRADVPKLVRNRDRQHLHVRPPGRLIAVPVQLPMVLAAERHGELVADLPNDRGWASLRWCASHGLA